MRAQVAIAEVKGAPVGTVAVLPPSLERLFVIPRYWGTGIGELLHGWAIATLRDARCQRAELVVLEANNRARNFYERRGWQIEGQPQTSHFPPYPGTLRYVRDLSG
jgi:GNAT superfamily N-acetyltransferase